MSLAFETMERGGGQRLPCQEPTAPVLSPDDIAIMLAGAQARGMADMLAMLGMGAVLLGVAGQVLHASAHAGEFLAGVVDFADGRMVCLSASAQEALESLVAVHPGPNHAQAVILKSAAGENLELRRLPAPAGPAGAPKLLSAIITVRAV